MSPGPGIYLPSIEPFSYDETFQFGALVQFPIAIARSGLQSDSTGADRHRFGPRSSSGCRTRFVIVVMVLGWGMGRTASIVYRVVRTVKDLL
jgi:hypothetical protein